MGISPENFLTQTEYTNDLKLLIFFEWNESLYILLKIKQNQG